MARASSPRLTQIVSGSDRGATQRPTRGRAAPLLVFGAAARATAPCARAVAGPLARSLAEVWAAAML